MGSKKVQRLSIYSNACRTTVLTGKAQTYLQNESTKQVALTWLLIAIINV